ncbi:MULTISPECIES: YceK/YidQ family lipoprotein [Pseudomonas]|jgi:uncharacterized protein YceK|nr:MULTISPECIES: YceK/YidQ family lipoprotein [Pseudomonas]ERT18529.2 hypothetical protein O162_11275 [Pseudomonas putida SJ3]
MRPWIGVMLAAGLAGCGTVHTVFSEAKAVDDLAKWQSDCRSIPRAYSGVAYQFCSLNAPARSGAHWAPFPVLVDMAASSLADTIVLPYTGYQQYERGNVPIRRLEY